MRFSLPPLLAQFILLLVYASTLQTIPNGAEHYFMIDVGETQIVLNVWGTLHATGYPLYVMLSSALVGLLRAVGFSAGAAPGIVSLLYGLSALALLYLLAARLVQRESSPPRGLWLAAALILLLGLTRTVWIHMVIAEIYSFGLLLLALLLALALWPAPIRHRVYWLALIGGLGVFHHRALLMAAPALLVAVWPELTTALRRRPCRVVIALALGLLGFLPYLYLPLRANAGAAWVYGDPGTWNGFWDQFFGREAARFIGPPGSWEALAANFERVNAVLVMDVTAPGIALGLLGLLLATRRAGLRRPAWTLLLGGLTAYGFHVLAYTDILSALILPVIVSLGFGWLFLADSLLDLRLDRLRPAPALGRFARLALAGLIVAGAALGLRDHNAAFIRAQTSDPTGLQTIELARGAPPGSTVMFAWGPRYFAASFAQTVQGDLAHIRLADHRADLRASAAAGRLVTPAYTFYNQPVDWWQARLGGRVYLSAAAAELVWIRLQPEISAAPPDPIGVIRAEVQCGPENMALVVWWAAARTPAVDLSVFVHLLDAGDGLIAQADQSAPVYGWRPLTTWTAGEIVRDVYPLPRRPAAALIRYGLYRQLESGEFVNEYSYEQPVDCAAP